MQQFDAIRPYSDDEVHGAIKRLLGDSDFLTFLGRLKAPLLARWFPALARFEVRRRLSAEFGGIDSIRAVQEKVRPYAEQAIRHTTTGLTQSGLDHLSAQETYLFVSNHRDIVFDPMVVNYLLFEQGFETTRIAIGDNLTKNPLAAEMMRLNKSFIVRRNITSPREMREVYLTLSAYISHSIADGHPVWIAQREGRAKDGIDRTDPAIIKMFHMSQKQNRIPFVDAMQSLNIVPVSIAYEYDPLDVAKAKELDAIAREGSYQKGENEDMENIIRGISGQKGRVHVAFGEPIQNPADNARDLAAQIDRQIIGNYHLFPSNYRAYELLRQREPYLGLSSLPTDDSAVSIDPDFQKRLDHCPEELQPLILRMYANPVLQQRYPELSLTPVTGGEGTDPLRE